MTKTLLRASAAAILLGISVAGWTSAQSAPPQAARVTSDPHAYFQELVARADHWKSYSFRDARMLGGKKYLTYDPARDTDPHRQDAAKIVIPAFVRTTVLAAPLAAGDVMLTVPETRRGIFQRGRVIQIDREIMTIVRRASATTAEVTRGTHGTQAAEHEAGAEVRHATNTLQSKLQFPLGTEDGHSYLFVWDSYWTDSFMGVQVFNHKAFQFFSGSRKALGAIWLEPQAGYGRVRAPYVANFKVRSYNKPGGHADWQMTNGNLLGPAAKGGDPLSPREEFLILPNTWTRFFLRVDQRPDDYDPVDMWVADETRDAVQVLSKIPISVRSQPNKGSSILAFQAEFNSSTDALTRPDQRDLVAYIRNFVALRDVRDVQPLLKRPLAGPAR